MALPPRLKAAKHNLAKTQNLLASVALTFNTSDQILSAELRRISEDLAGATTHIDRAWSDHKAVNL